MNFNADRNKNGTFMGLGFAHFSPTKTLWLWLILVVLLATGLMLIIVTAVQPNCRIQSSKTLRTEVQQDQDPHLAPPIEATLITAYIGTAHSDRPEQTKLATTQLFVSDAADQDGAPGWQPVQVPQLPDDDVPKNPSQVSRRVARACKWDIEWGSGVCVWVDAKNTKVEGWQARYDDVIRRAVGLAKQTGRLVIDTHPSFDQGGEPDSNAVRTNAG